MAGHPRVGGMSREASQRPEGADLVVDVTPHGLDGVLARKTDVNELPEMEEDVLALEFVLESRSSSRRRSRRKLTPALRTTTRWPQRKRKAPARSLGLRRWPAPRSHRNRALREKRVVRTDVVAVTEPSALSALSAALPQGRQRRRGFTAASAQTIVHPQACSCPDREVGLSLALPNSIE